MKMTDYNPVLLVGDVAATADFYIRHFGFRAAVDVGFYVHLQLDGQPNINLAVMDGDHPTIPEGHRGRTQGLILNFEVDDADAEYARLRDAGVTILQDIRSEEFGQRHFILADPNGILIDVIKLIPPTGAFAGMFAGGGGQG
jgi:catechol 2,3-dioxygenase-like lactoylglutathione lyase family enzyme